MSEYPVPVRALTYHAERNDVEVGIAVHADLPVDPTNWVTARTYTIDPPLTQGHYEVLVWIRWGLDAANRSGLLRVMSNGVPNPYYQQQPSHASNIMLLTLPDYFVSDGVTPHVIEVQGLVDNQPGNQVMTVYATGVRVCIMDAFIP